MENIQKTFDIFFSNVFQLTVIIKIPQPQIWQGDSFKQFNVVARDSQTL